MRILITGPECTGKSTLSKLLSDSLGIPWFPEYARTYLEENGSEYNEADLLQIGQTHHHLLHCFTPDQPLILDTYLLNLVIWSNYKYGRCHKWLTQNAANAQFDRVLLLAPDIEWRQDGLRENERERAKLFELFKKKFEEYGISYSVVKGQGRDRLNAAIVAIKTI